MRAIAIALVLGSTLGLSGSVATYGVSGPQPPEAPRPAAARALPLMFEPGRSGEDFRARGRGYDVTVGRYGAGALASLGNLLACFYVVCLAFIFLILAPLSKAFGFSQDGNRSLASSRSRCVTG